MEAYDENNKVIVFTEMQEFVRGLQLDHEQHNNSKIGDVFDVMDDELKETMKKDHQTITFRESGVGKGLSGALKFLKDRGTLNECSGQNTDKEKEIRIERRDEYGRILTPKHAFRLFSHDFHGKRPGKTKQEKRVRQYHQELKTKVADATSIYCVERMREAQAKLQTPCLVLSGNVKAKTGLNSDLKSAFATLEKRFLNGKRESELGDHAAASDSQKKPETNS